MVELSMQCIDIVSVLLWRAAHEIQPEIGVCVLLSIMNCVIRIGRYDS